jgi:mycoredoxin-dependent peroxiredoxin
VAIEIGAEAPDFALRDQHNVVITLAEQRPKAVLLVFYPLAFTGVCAGELNLIQHDLDRLQNDRVQVLGISVDSPYTQRVFADRDGMKFPLLADFWPHGATAQDYGVFDENAGVATRASFLIDGNGIVRWRTLSDIGHPRDHALYHQALAELGV